mmetsp:Transcript_54970/g.109290  ORF Transcript_54970/g.109290 Transcript_54970/m.109290 type:complete len:112 (+) Transcript_54970:3-338(+)
MAAVRAPWPRWEFVQNGNHIKFINRGPLGELQEEFEAGGPEYIAIDGRKQQITCKSFWEGETLITEKCGPQGPFREERRFDPNGELHFVLRSLEPSHGGASWGRTFVRRPS